MTLARKAFTPHELKLDDTGSLELAFAQFNVVDSDGDVTLPGAFPGKEVPISAYGHTSWDGALPVGKGTISEAGDWAVLKGHLFMDTTGGRDTHATLKGLGSLAEFSYGYNVLVGEQGQFDGKNVRFLKSLDPFEISPVLKGAGVGTHLMSIKSGRPEPDAPYAALLSWYAEGLPDLLDRVKDRAAFRAKEGRVLSAANIATLAELAEALEGHTGAVRDLIAAATPPDPAKQAQFRAAEMENLLAIARANGVSLD